VIVTSLRTHSRVARPFGRAFTLIETIVVLAIIGMILALSLPHFRHMNEGRTMEAAVRQLLDDLAFARQTAIATRSTVAVVFVPPDVQALTPTLSKYNSNEIAQIYNLQAGALTTYAIFSFRKPGDQPGRNAINYVREWKSLPEKIFIAESMFDPANSGISTYPPPNTNAFLIERFPFPQITSLELDLPYIAFSAEGYCLPLALNTQTFRTRYSGIVDKTYTHDIYIPLASGVIMYTRNPDGTLASWNVQEVPPNNSINTSNVIHIDWLTGRAKLERADVTHQ
jgi:prepilin-type N-terminal cleavage/methylation domain-containing protein